MRSAERRKVNVLEMKCLRSLGEVLRMDRVSNEEVRRRTGIEREFSEWSRSENIGMVWACGNNGRVPYGQKGVDEGSKWRADTRETEVRVDGWCEGGLWQQRNDGGGCASMR